MAVISTPTGWKCEGCGVTHQSTIAVWRECKCDPAKMTDEELLAKLLEPIE